jgi:formylglycine-generating enzyme required for sulfatase activity
LTGGGVDLSPADLTVRWAPAAQWDTIVDGGAPDLASAPATPRLTINGGDATPPSEPLPNLAIDYLTDVNVVYGQRMTADVLLTGECLGTMADLANGATCVATAGARAPVIEAPLGSGIARGGPSVSGSWAGEQSTPCTTQPRAPSTGLFDDEVCIAGGAFTVGSARIVGLEERDAAPVQVAIVAPFLLDKYEVTVGRYRDALKRGFNSPDSLTPLANDAQLYQRPNTGEWCTFNGDASGPAMGVNRESYPLNCVSWYTARAFCQFEGGDLPTHVQWEYAAVGAPDGKTIYPWGEDDPSCARTAFQRDIGQPCFDTGGVTRGPVPVDHAPWVTADVTRDGVTAMGGNLSEWVIDSFRPYSDACWWQSPLRGVACNEVEAPRRSSRGGGWNETPDIVQSASLLARQPAVPIAPLGFRCARPGAGK